MKKILICLLINLAAQLPAQHIFPPKLLNKKTKKHIHIAGSRFSIILPTGFYTKPGFIGIEKSDSASIQLVDTKDPKLQNSLLEEFFGAAKDIIDSGTTELGIFKTKFLIFERNNMKYFFLCFGDSSFTGFVNASWVKSDSITNQDMIKAIYSICFDKSLKYDPLEVASFTVDESKSIFKFSDYDIAVFTYTPEGKKMVTSDLTASSIEIGMFPFKDTSITALNIASYFANQIQTDERFNIYKTKVLSDLPINGYPSNELLMYGIQDHKQLYVYQMVMIHRQSAVFLTAYIRSDHESQLAEARKLAATIKFK